MRAGAAFLVGALLVGCAGAPGATTSQVATLPVASTPVTPSATPLDVAAAFAAQMRSLDGVRAEMTGYVEIGTRHIALSGEMANSGGESLWHPIFSENGTIVSESGTATIAGASYEWASGGFWLKVEPTSEPSEPQAGHRDPIQEALNDLDRLQVRGDETIGGVRFIVLQPDRDVVLAAEDFGFENAENFEAELRFYAKPDGAPGGMELSATWMQGTSDRVPEAAAMQMRFMFTHTGPAVSVGRGVELWETYASELGGYEMAHPVSWDVSTQPADGEYAPYEAYVGPVDGEVDVYTYTDIPPSTPPNAWFRWSQEGIQEWFDIEPTVAADLELADGTPVRLFALNGNDERGAFYFQEAVVFAGDIAWQVDWYSEAGDEQEDRETFLKFVASFRRAS